MHVITVLARSARIYLWPCVLANAALAGLVVRMPFFVSLQIGFILSLLASAGFLTNDLVDRKIDRVNDKKRLQGEPAKVLWGVGMLAAACLVAAMGIAVLAGGVPVVALSAAVSCGLLLYNFVLRATPVAATVLAASLCCSPIWFPFALQAEHLTWVHYLVVTMTLFGACAREIMLDVGDRPGDAAFGRRTLPVMLGDRVASVLSFVLMCVSCGLGLVLLVQFAQPPLRIGLVAGFVLVSLGAVLKPSLEVVLRPSRPAVNRYVRLTRIGQLLIPTMVLAGTFLLP